MRLLLVGTAPETEHLARSLVMTGTGSITHCSEEHEALRLVQSGVRFDWVIAEVDAAPSLSQQISLRLRPAPAITFLDWRRQQSQPTGADAEAPKGLVNEGESPWVLEYHVPRRRGSMA